VLRGQQQVGERLPLTRAAAAAASAAERPARSSSLSHKSLTSTPTRQGQATQERSSHKQSSSHTLSTSHRHRHDPPGRVGTADNPVRPVAIRASTTASSGYALFLPRYEGLGAGRGDARTAILSLTEIKMYGRRAALCGNVCDDTCPHWKAACRVARPVGKSNRSQNERWQVVRIEGCDRTGMKL
jgi:hypothetical protein